MSFKWCITDAIGLDSLLVKVAGLLPEVPTLSGDTLTCLTDEANVYVNFSSNVDSFYWLNDLDNGSADSIFRTDSAGLLQLVLLGSEGCIDTIIHAVEIDTISPSFTIDQNGELSCADVMVRLTADVDTSLGHSYDVVWRDDVGNVLPKSDDRSIELDESGWYFLEVLDQSNGCLRIDSVFVDRQESTLQIDSLFIESPAMQGR